MRAQAERFGAELVTDDVSRGRPRRARSRSSPTPRARAPGARRDPGHGLGLPRARPARREAALRPRRLLVRHLRRLLLPRPGHRRRRRRRLRDRGGHLPHPVRPHGHDRAPPRRAARLARSCRSAPSPTRRSGSPGTPRSPRSTATTSSTGVTLRDTVTGETRELAVTGLFIAIGHDPRTELLTGRSTSTTRATCSSRAAPPAPTSPGVFACGDLVDHTYRQAITAAGTGCAAALDAERYLADLEHAAGPVTQPSRSVIDTRRDLSRHRPHAPVRKDPHHGRRQQDRHRRQLRGRRPQDRQARARRLLGRVVRPVPPGRPDPRRDRRASTATRSLRQAERRREPGVTGAPTASPASRRCNVYQDGEVVKTIVGAKPKATLLRELEDFIG